MNHDERWAVVRESHLSRLYIGEVQALLISCLEAAEQLGEIAPIDLGNAIKVDAEVGIHAHRLISAAGRLQGLLFASPRGKGESLKRCELRTRRVEWLRNRVFADIDVGILNDRGVRNSIEHFDDRLDEIAEKAADGAYEFPLFVVADIAIGHDDVLGLFDRVQNPPKTVQHVRTYVADTRTFHVLRWSFSVDDVTQCCKVMLDRLIDDGWVEASTVADHRGSILVQNQRPANEIG